MLQNVHCHNFNGKTTENREHRHGLSGITSEDLIQSSHTHRLVGYITFNHGHEHSYCITTGPGLEVEDGHMHYYQGVTNDSHNHMHFVYGYTSIFR